MVTDRASRLHFSSIVVDTHCDSLHRPVQDGEDIGVLSDGGHLDLPRMRAGHQTAQFFACYAEPELIKERKVIRVILDYIDAFHRLCADHPDEIEQARTAKDVRRIVGEGKLAAVLCVEGGHAIEDDLAVLRVYHQLGMRYMTLTWNNTNNWADGVLDEPRHNGLTDFGREVVREMDRLGVMVDVSHASPKTFWDVIETSSRPVIASHSSAKAISDAPRNLDDDQIRTIADRGGVIGVAYEITFLSERCRLESESLMKRSKRELAEAEARHAGDNEALRKVRKEARERYIKTVESKFVLPSYTEIVDHIDHIARTAGIDHVGLGSDFDGAIMPSGMEDCSKLPWITDELLKRDYSDEAVRKILGENTIRVMEEVIGE